MKLNFRSILKRMQNRLRGKPSIQPTTASKRPHHSKHWIENSVGLMNSWNQYAEEIHKGNVPFRYARIAAYVPGRRILELGSGEGVLALLMGQTKEHVTAIDINNTRYDTALRLRDSWSKLGRSTNNVEFICGNLIAQLDKYSQADTLVAVRVIYHLQEDIDKLFSALPNTIKHVVLVGNRDKARLYEDFKKGAVSHDLGEYLYYATARGMQDVLKKYGFSIQIVDEFEDAIVVGCRK